MKYFEVWVGNPRYHAETPLTYSHGDGLAVGSIVVVPLQRQTVPAVVLKEVGQPAFSTKPITRLVSAETLPGHIIQLLEWLRTYYPGPLGQIVSLALPGSLAQQSRQPQPTIDTRKVRALPPLTAEQTEVAAKIHEVSPGSILLHGDTGTGKTRIYLELIAGHLATGRSAMVLTPEIGLTPQLALACDQAFPGQTVVIHSELTPAERRRTWLRILETNDPLVVIGPRSALFAPVKKLGLIVIDEFHDTAYKQEQAPHYLASRVAAKLAKLHGAQAILGSATPLVTDYFFFREKALPIIRMTEQAVKLAPGQADIKLIDLKNREGFNRSPWLCDLLIAAIQNALEKKQQSLVFLNRRGTARLILCQACGWQAACPRCDLPLTYHGDKHSMQCHTCGFSDYVPLSCPECSSNDIIFRQIGTKSLVSELEKLFPQAKVQRFDSDNLKSERFERHFASVKEGAVDILVGTQILGKGLDLPRLSVLGVVVADTSLSFPDYTAEERTFQLLTQVIGRVHRGHIAGSAYIQTYQPDNPVLLAAINKDYKTFYEQQLAERKLYSFPPFRFVLKLTCDRASSQSARSASEKLAEHLRATYSGIEVTGPSPAFVEKTHDRYRWQLIIKAVRRPKLLGIIKDLPANWHYDIDPVNLL
jgi:primosomal protein N' (replication factor Y)